MNRSVRAAFSNADGSGICHVHSLFRRFAVEVFVVGLRVDAGIAPSNRDAAKDLATRSVRNYPTDP